ncbi:MAG TPA: sulfite exporter TauE/SafE family protein [Terriglobales bacterium]|nr:sulfite exporter TauE/SafE family protein [Terriglobales bacterium]
MEVVLGFLIAATVGVTGIGGGSFTTPALVLLIGLPAGEAVGTAMVFAAVLRLIAAPFYLVRRNVDARYLRFLLIGAVPGLLLGTLFLRLMRTRVWSPVALLVIGVMLTISSALTFLPRIRHPHLTPERGRWLSLLALPIGIETGFSSAGAGALGSILLLNFSELSSATVVGTDLLLGIVLAVVGSIFHLSWGSISTDSLLRLLAGGVPGVLVGCALAKRVPAQKLRLAVAAVAVALGLQLIWIGGAPLVRTEQARTVVRSVPKSSAAINSSASNTHVGASGGVLLQSFYSLPIGVTFIERCCR